MYEDADFELPSDFVAAHAEGVCVALGRPRHGKGRHGPRCQLIPKEVQKERQPAGQGKCHKHGLSPKNIIEIVIYKKIAVIL